MKTIAIRVVLLAVCIIGSVCFAPVIVNADGFVLWADIITEIDDLVPSTKITLNSITESEGVVTLPGVATRKMYAYDFAVALENSSFFIDIDFNFGDCPDMANCSFVITAPLEQKPFSIADDFTGGLFLTDIDRCDVISVRSDAEVAYEISNAASEANIKAFQYSPTGVTTILINGTTYQVNTYSVKTCPVAGLNETITRQINFLRQLDDMPWNYHEIRNISLNSSGDGLWELKCDLGFVFLPRTTPTPTPTPTPRITPTPTPRMTTTPTPTPRVTPTSTPTPTTAPTLTPTQQSATTPAPATTTTVVPTATKSTPTPVSNNPTPTPTSQLNSFISAAIGPSGGTVETSDGSVKVTFPAGTLSYDTTVTISSGSCHPSGGGYLVGDTCFSIIPSGALSGDATICMEYSDYDLNLANGDTSLLTLGYYSGGQWHEATDVYVSGNEICCTTDHLSDWAVLIEQISKASSVPIAVYIGGGIGAIAVLVILAALRRRVTVSNKTTSRIGRMRTQMEEWRGEGYDVSDLEDLFK